MSAAGPRSGGFGVVGVGDPGSPSPHRTRPDLCAEHGHPGDTFNPWEGATWCLCGDVVRAGHHVVLPKASTCGGPLVECRHPETAVRAGGCGG